MSNSDAAAGRPAPEHYAHPALWDTPLPLMSVPEMFLSAAERYAERPLIEFMGRQFSYAEISASAHRFAAGLQNSGVQKGDRVGLFSPNVPVYAAAYYGAMMAGATVVNFSPLYSPDELAHQVEDSGTRLLVTVDAAQLLPTALQVLDKSGLERLIVARMTQQLSWVKSTAMRLLRRRDLASLPARADVEEWQAALSNAAPQSVAIDPEADLALLQYTGGTTGTPKGAMLSHRNLTANALQVDAIDPFEGREVILGALPLFHVFANTSVLNRTVRRGGCIVMLPRFVPDQVLGAIKRTRATAFPGVPTMFQALLDHTNVQKSDLASLDICVSGGAPLPAPLREAWEEKTGVRLVEGYGLTESAGVVSVNPYEGKRKPGTIGQLLPDTRAILLDKEDPSQLAAAGQPGELAVCGPQVMRGYWRREDAQARAFAQHEGRDWLRTGDIATIDDEGFISIVDRSKDMISVGGFKVFPSRVEAVLVEHEAVHEALVLGMPDEYMGETPRAFIALKPGVEADPDEIASWLNARVGKHERVDSVVVRDALPKTMIGKLDRKALRAEIERESE